LIIRRLQAGDLDLETLVEGKRFTARHEDSGVAIYLGETKWRVVSKENFDDYFSWFDYCAKHNFSKASRDVMKRRIRDVESSSYVFALIKRYCKS